MASTPTVGGTNQPGFIERWKTKLLPSGNMTPQEITKYATTVLIISAVAIVAAILIAKFPAASYAYYSAFGLAGGASVYFLATNYKKAQAEKEAARLVEEAQTKT